MVKNGVWVPVYSIQGFGLAGKIKGEGTSEKGVGKTLKSWPGIVSLGIIAVRLVRALSFFYKVFFLQSLTAGLLLHDCPL